MPEPNSGCQLWLGSVKRTGYGTVKSKAQGQLLTHRAAWQVAFGPIPHGMHVLHKCDVRSCVNPAHLSLGTNLQNIADKVAKGRQCRGAMNGNALLTDDIVRAIRRDPCNNREAARIYGVSYYTIWDVRTGRSWKHVSPE